LIVRIVFITLETASSAFLIASSIAKSADSLMIPPDST
jgi:hypothetical protein